MTREKPPKCQDKVNIEANFFEIEMKLKELRQNPYVPPGVNVIKLVVFVADKLAKRAAVFVSGKPLRPMKFLL
jgi:hypothetical protein